MILAQTPSHSQLTNLTGNDDHTQYAILAGRSGGQVLIGDTASGGDLTLQSTVHATKGKVIFGAAGTTYFDETTSAFNLAGNITVTGSASLLDTLKLISTTTKPNEQAWYTSTSTLTALIGGAANDFYINVKEAKPFYIYTNDTLRLTIASDGAATFSGAATVTGLLTANDDVTLGDNSDLIGSSTSDITINTDKFTVAGATGNTVIGGTLGVTGILFCSADAGVQQSEVWTPSLITGLRVVSANSAGDGNFGGSLILGQANGGQGGTTGSAIVSYQDGADANYSGLKFYNHNSSDSGDPRNLVLTIERDGASTFADALTVTGLLTATSGITMPDDTSITWGATTIAQSDLGGVESILISQNECGSEFIIENHNDRNELLIISGGGTFIGNATDSKGMTVKGITIIDTIGDSQEDLHLTTSGNFNSIRYETTSSGSVWMTFKNDTYSISGGLSNSGRYCISTGNDLTGTNGLQVDQSGAVYIGTGGLVPITADTSALGSATLEWSDLYLADGGVIYMGDDQDVTLTHVADTGILLNGAHRLQFGDSGTYIYQSADGILRNVSDTQLVLDGGGNKITISSTTTTFDENVSMGGTITAVSDINTAESYNGINNVHQKLGGATNASDSLIGITTSTKLNQSGGTEGTILGINNTTQLTLGTIESNFRGINNQLTIDAGTVNCDIVGSWNGLTLTTGTITGNIYGVATEVLPASGLTSITGSIYGNYINVSSGEDPSGSVYMLYLDEGTNVDYGIYQNGSAPNVFGGKINLPYLGSAPSGLTNGDMWMESDGLHIYYGGVEKVVAGA